MIKPVLASLGAAVAAAATLPFVAGDQTGSSPTETSTNMAGQARQTETGTSNAAAPTTTSNAASSPTVLYVTTTGPTKPIDPRIYGVAFATTQVLTDLNLPLNRSGGNSATLFNWQANARNTGSDFYFESVPTSTSITDQFEDGFVSATKNGAAAPMITIPSIGWTAKLGVNGAKLAAFSILKYGAQASADYSWFPDAGNGTRPDGSLVTGNDPTDAAMAVTDSFATKRVTALVKRWGQSTAGGVSYYVIDNEPSLWHLTHRGVHPAGAHAEEIASRTIATAAAIAQSDPTAQIVAPEEWGWGGYFDSGYDQQGHGQNRPAGTLDRATQTGGLDYLPYLLQRWSAAGHPVDIVSVHYYPQGGEYGSDDAGSREIQLLRNVSTRSLWDPNYVDRSWINAKVMLIPRLRGWVNQYYAPGAPIAITEYNWGGGNSMSGAVAQADIWGIFGREGLDMAARWQAPQPGTPTYLAMKLIRNYDGNGGAFGDRSLPTAVPDPDTISAFAARRSGDHAVTVLVINKDLDAARAVRFKLAGVSGPAAVYRLVAGALTPPAAIPIKYGVIADTLPAQSIALYVVTDVD